MNRLSKLEEVVEPTELVDSKGLLQKVKGWYFEPKAVEKWRNGKVYEVLGVKKFKKLLTHLNAYNLTIKTPSDLDNLDRVLNDCELFHFPQAVVWGGVTAYYLSNESYISTMIFGVLSLTNAYCAMLQRYNRIKTNRIRQRMQERLEMSTPYQ